MDTIKESLVNRIIEFAEDERIEVNSLRGLPLVFQENFRSEIWPWDVSYDKVAQLGMEFRGEKIRLLFDKYASYDTIYGYGILAGNWNEDPVKAWDNLFSERTDMIALGIESNITSLKKALKVEKKKKLKELRNELP